VAVVEKHTQKQRHEKILNSQIWTQNLRLGTSSPTVHNLRPSIMKFAAIHMYQNIRFGGRAGVY